MAVRKLLLDLVFLFVCLFVLCVGRGCFVVVVVLRVCGFCLFGSFYFLLGTVLRVLVMTVFLCLAIIPPLDLQLTVLV